MQLISFRTGPEGLRPGAGGLSCALVALWHGDRLLMVHERSRGRWELPGGGIEDGETPLDAAIRELREERGQRAESLRFVDFATVAAGPERRIVRSALYTGETSAPRGFAPTEEIAAIAWWDGGRTAAGPDAGGRRPPGRTYSPERTRSTVGNGTVKHGRSLAGA
jgi:8-oxo-dGTP pyrophosphatase MutT (NUDIX family)